MGNALHLQKSLCLWVNLINCFDLGTPPSRHVILKAGNGSPVHTPHSPETRVFQMARASMATRAVTRVGGATVESLNADWKTRNQSRISDTANYNHPRHPWYIFGCHRKEQGPVGSSRWNPGANDYLMAIISATHACGCCRSSSMQSLCHGVRTPPRTEHP